MTQSVLPAAHPQRPQRVLFVVNSLRAGGAEKHVLSLLEQLDTAQFTLGLVYLRRVEQLLPQVPRARLALLGCVEAKRYLHPPAIVRLAREIDRFAPDVVVCTNMWSLFNVGLARWLARRRFCTVEVFHTTMLTSRKERFQLAYHRPLFARTDLLIYVCHTQQQYWRDLGLRAKREAVVHNGIDLAYYEDRWSVDDKLELRKSLDLQADDFVIGLCGVFRPEKNHGDLLRAVAALRAHGLPAKALLIGDGPERPRIERLAAEIGIAEHVRMTGFQRDVRPFVAICDVMTLMSRTETFSIAALEAMAMGKPLVMTNVGGAAEQVKDGVNGFLFPPGDVEACVQRLSSLIDRTLREEMGAAGVRKMQEQFSIRQMILAYSTLLRELQRPTRDALHHKSAHAAGQS